MYEGRGLQSRRKMTSRSQQANQAQFNGNISNWYTIRVVNMSKMYARPTSIVLKGMFDHHSCYKFSRCASMQAAPTIGDARALNKLVRMIKTQPVYLAFHPLKGACRIVGFPDASYKNNEDKSSQRALTIFLAEQRSTRGDTSARGSLIEYESHKITATTMSTTVASLARAFGIVVRQIADLLTMLQDYSALAPTLPRILDISYQESITLQHLIEYLMKPNWEWLMSVLDSTEAQLRFGSALAGSTDPSNPSHPMFATSRISRTNNGGSSTAIGGSSSSHHGGHNVGGHGSSHGAGHLERAPGFSTSRATALASLTGSVSMSSDPQSNRRDFLNYALSLMRAHNAEHSDSLPVIDVSAMKHIAYVFDALIYYMRSGTEAIDDGHLTMSSAAITTPQALSAISILRSNTGISVAPAVSGPSNLNVYGEDNDPDDPNDDSLLDESNSHQNVNQTTGSGPGSAQPMELDYDDENTNQSTASNQGAENKSLLNTSGRHMNQAGVDNKNRGQHKGEPEKEKSSNSNTASLSNPHSGHRNHRGRKHLQGNNTFNLKPELRIRIQSLENSDPY